MAAYDLDLTTIIGNIIGLSLGEIEVPGVIQEIDVGPNIQGPLRVRMIIEDFNYMDLAKNKVLPKEKLFTKVPAKGLLSGHSKKYGPVEYGLTMERFMELAIKNRDYDVSRILSEIGIESEPKTLPSYNYLMGSYRANFAYPQYAQFREEWTDGEVQGHPDLVYGDTVFEMKTTSSFTGMRSQTILQVLAYYALAQRLNKGIKKVGLILPIQSLVLIHDLTGWDSSAYWNVLVGAAAKKKGEIIPINPFEMAHNFALIREYVGTTVDKDSLFEYLKGTSQPLQFFVAGRTQAEVPANLDRPLLTSLIRDLSREVFIHTPYTLNLSNIETTTQRNPGVVYPYPWVAVKLGFLLQFGWETGIKGVVIHTGKQAALDFDTALSYMTYNLKIVLRFIDPRCPLLLETPAGHNGELLAEKDLFIKYYLSLKKSIEEEGAQHPEYHYGDFSSKVKVCLDTCHVFSAGYNPIEYLTHLESEGIGIGLIHFNDSKYPKGAKKDRHAPIFQGRIPPDELMAVYHFAKSRKIPCVVE